MKKSILALAVASALAAPLAVQADTILYGSARVSIDYVDENSNLNSVDDFLNSDGYWDIANNSSRLGVLGSEDLGGGLSAIYQYEFGVDVTEGGNFESNRPKLVGLKGGFGQISIGTQETPYYHVVGVADTFNSGRTFGSTAWLGGAFAGNDVRGPGDLVRLDNSLYYITPDMGGLSIEAMIAADGTGLTDTQGFTNDVDLWNIGLKYSNGPFFAGLSYVKLNGDSRVSFGEDNLFLDLDLDQWALGLGYSSGPFSVAFIYEQGDLNGHNLGRKIKNIRGIPLFKGDDAQNYYLTGAYQFGPNTIRAAYGQLDTGINGEDNIENYLLGYQYDFSKRTAIWVEYVGRNADTLLFGDSNAISIGTRVDF